MGLTREERIVRELQKQCSADDRHHYVIVSSHDGFVAFSGASSERMQKLLGEVVAEAIGIELRNSSDPVEKK